AEGLRSVHVAGITHRDLKPSNILITPDAPVIIDFGVAAAADATALTATGGVVGSAGWMAPEQVLGKPVGPATDVHAWAAVVAYAGTGRAPFGLGRPEALTYRIVHSDPDLAGIPDELSHLLHRALDKDPARRPTLDEIRTQLGQGDPAAVTLAASA